jgi:hypothetical protein
MISEKEILEIEECILTLGTNREIDPWTLESIRRYALAHYKKIRNKRC